MSVSDFSVSTSSCCASISVNLPTFSCGRKVHRLFTVMPRSSFTTSSTLACVVSWPSSRHLDLLVPRSRSRRIVTSGSRGFFPRSVISTHPFSLSRITKSPTEPARSSAV